MLFRLAMPSYDIGPSHDISIISISRFIHSPQFYRNEYSISESILLNLRIAPTLFLFRINPLSFSNEKLSTPFQFLSVPSSFKINLFLRCAPTAGHQGEVEQPGRLPLRRLWPYRNDVPGRFRGQHAEYEKTRGGRCGFLRRNQNCGRKRVNSSPRHGRRDNV